MLQKLSERSKTVSEAGKTRGTRQDKARGRGVGDFAKVYKWRGCLSFHSPKVEGMGEGGDAIADVP